MAKVPASSALDGPAGGNAAEQDGSIRETILSCTSESEVERLIAEPLRRYVGGDGVTALFFRRAPTNEIVLETAYAASLPDDCHTQYTDKFYTLDPMVQRHLKPLIAAPSDGAAATPFLVDDLARVADSQDSQYLEEFWRPFGLSHMVGLLIRPINHDDEVVVLAVHRFSGAKPFGERHLERLRRVAAPSRLVCSLLISARAERRATEVANALGRWMGDAGYATLDRRGQVAFATGQALRHWAGDESRRAEVLRRLGDPAKSVFYLDAEGTELQIAAQRNKQTGEVLILSGQIADDAVQRARATAFGLSRREVEVAVSVARGLSNAETAQLLKISNKTVENHLRAVFDTVGVDNRTSLARVLMGGR